VGRAVGGSLMMKNPDRLVCGLATVFGTRTRGGRIWYREEFDAWLNSRLTAVPLRLDHGPVWDIRGALTNIGTAREFAVVDQPAHGLLALVELDQGAWHDSLLRDIQEHLELKPWLPPWGFSLGAQHIPGEHVLPDELSLTMEPAFREALVFTVGADSLYTWNMLTGEPVATSRS
jgi:hypothetical protein